MYPKRLRGLGAFRGFPFYENAIAPPERSTEMVEESGKANALQAIGAYMCAYSEVTYELGETLKVLFRITNNEMADAIVAALGDFARQANLVGALCRDARNADDTELSNEQKEQINGTISACLACNIERVKLAHGRLEPRADGSVAIVHLKVDKNAGVKGKDPVVWSPTEWTKQTTTLTKLASQLRNFQKELKTIKLQATSLIGLAARLG